MVQCEAWQPLNLPGLLVADPRLGGISATISAFETLLLRGKPPTAIVSVRVRATGAERCMHVHS